MNRILIVVLSVFLLGSCKSYQSFTKKSINKSEVFKQSFTGFSLFDLSENKIVFEKNADKYFQPASNNKLFTLYASLKTLGDSVPALKYITKGDSLIFWGTGDPSLLHPDLPKSQVIDFLKNRPEKLFYSNSNEVQNRFGSGWMLEDYNEYYQAEISALPVYGNIVRFNRKGENWHKSPNIFCINVDSLKNTNQNIVRDLNENCFSLPQNKNLAQNFTQDVPFITSIDYILTIFKDTLRSPISVIDLPLPENFKTIYSIRSDSLFKRMLLVSDNMIAEQIILLASKSDTLDASKSIENILKTHLSDLPDNPRWVDGSGLSRYNLTTPRSLVHVLKKIYAEFPKERIFDLMPTKNDGIYAKSGSYSNNYNLSGYLIGNSGKTYAFSFMNNNFMVPTKEIRKEVDRILVGLKGKL